MTSPCHRCPRRAPCCHSACPEYLAYRRDRDADLERRQARRQRETAVSEVQAASRNKTTRRDSVHDRLRR